MREKRKKVALFIAVLFWLAALPGSGVRAFAADGAEPVVSGGNVSAVPGAAVAVEITITNNPGILGATLRFSFPEELTLTAAEAGAAFSCLTMTRPGRYESPCKFVWDGSTLDGEDVGDGVILTLTFRVSEAARVGEALSVGISYDAGAVVDEDLEPVSLQTVNGTVVVSDRQTDTPRIASAAGAAQDGTITLWVKSLDEHSGAFLMLAAYSGAGKLLGCEVRGADLAAGDNSFSFRQRYRNADYKAFLLSARWWPCCQAIAITVQKPF